MKGVLMRWFMPILLVIVWIVAVYVTYHNIPVWHTFSATKQWAEVISILVLAGVTVISLRSGFKNRK